MGAENGQGKAKKLILILVIVNLLAAGLGFKLKDKSDELERTQNDNPEDICLTEECVKASAYILNAMDKTIEPCEDFYKFACANWEKNNPIPESTSSWNLIFKLQDELGRKVKDILESEVSTSDPRPLQEAKQYYNSCMKQNSPDLTELKSLLDVELRLGEINNTNVGFKLGEVRRLAGVQVLISNLVELDDEDTSKHVFYIDQPSFSIYRAYLVSDNPIKVAYQDLIQKVWPLVYENLDPNFDLVGFSKSIVDFESAIANITTPPEDRRNFTQLYNLMSIQDLQTLTSSPLIDWTAFITEIFKDVVERYDVSLNDILSQNLVVRDIKYYEQLGEVLQTFMSTDPKVLENYAKWRVIFTFGNDVNEMLREIFFEFSKTISGAEISIPRWKMCSDTANLAYGMAIGHRYVQDALGDGFKEQMSEMIQDVKTALNGIIDEVDWFGTEETRSKAKQKADKMSTFIGYPDWLLDNSTALEHYYEGLTLKNEDNHFQNAVDLARWKSLGALKRIMDPKDPNRWISDPTIVNAFYYVYVNSITFPAGILQPPYYYAGNTIQALNYGAVGMAIGHEITHGFDDLGRQFDGDGNLLNWWDDETVNQFRERAECYVSQYESYFVEEANMTLNGRNSLGENIADNGGLREAFRAYQSFVARNGQEPKLPGLDYTPEQIFFLAFAQIWCSNDTPEALQDIIQAYAYTPFPYRVRAVLQNSFEFAETWNCPLPDTSKACKIW